MAYLIRIRPRAAVVVALADAAERYDVVVLGAGVIGASIAYRAAAHGAAVLVVDADSRGGLGSRAAAGIAVPSVRLLADPLMRDFAAEGARVLAADLRRIDPEGHLTVSCGILRPARSGAEAEALAADPAAAESVGAWIPAQAVAELEPSLDVSRMAGAFRAECGLVVDPEGYLDHLLRAAEAVGAHLVLGCRAALSPGGSSPRVVLRASPGGSGAAQLTVTAGAVVVAAGAWSGEVTADVGRAPVGPRRGQMMRLGDVPGARLSHIVSGTLYLAPGVGGGLIVGATEEDCGFEVGPTLAGMLLLSAHASRMVPAARDARVERIWSGYRAATPDGRPVIGWSTIRGVLIAAGHGGQGILTAAVTGEAVAGLLNGRHTPWSVPFSPQSLETR